MKTRCYNDKHERYDRYGGRSIKVCDRWLESFVNFQEDMLPTYKEGLQLDRVNNNGDYTPDNCRWTTASENMKNRQIKAEFQSNIPNVLWNKSKQKWEYIKRFDSKKRSRKFCETKGADMTETLLVILAIELGLILFAMVGIFGLDTFAIFQRNQSEGTRTLRLMTPEELVAHGMDPKEFMNASTAKAPGAVEAASSGQYL